MSQAAAVAGEAERGAGHRTRDPRRGYRGRSSSLRVTVHRWLAAVMSPSCSQPLLLRNRKLDLAMIIRTSLVGLSHRRVRRASPPAGAGGISQKEADQLQDRGAALQQKAAEDLRGREVRQDRPPRKAPSSSRTTRRIWPDDTIDAANGSNLPPDSPEAARRRARSSSTPPTAGSSAHAAATPGRNEPARHTPDGLVVVLDRTSGQNRRFA